MSAHLRYRFQMVKALHHLGRVASLLYLGACPEYSLDHLHPLYKSS